MKKIVVNIENKKVKDLEISEDIFGLKVFPDLIHQYIRYQNAKSRQGSHKTKTRSEVSGRSKKPFSQKGTHFLEKQNRARRGQTRLVCLGRPGPLGLAQWPNGAQGPLIRVSRISYVFT